MLRRQDSLLASTRRHTPRPAPESHHVIKSSGCMSGIIQLISKYQNKTKRLSSGIIRKQGKHNGTSSQKRASLPPPKVVVVEVDKLDLVKVSRSSTIQPEIRRRGNNNNSPENVKKEAALLVARPAGPVGRANNESTEVKRRKLLEALEKCNDDLESIRKIINSVEIGDTMKRRPPGRVKAKDNGHITQQESQALRIKQLEAYEPVDIFKKFSNNEPFPMKPVATTSRLWCSKAMIQSVEEVCNDTAWGQKREAGRIGLVLQDHIYRDLIEELVKEMDLLCLPSLFFFKCKKRLFF